MEKRRSGFSQYLTDRDHAHAPHQLPFPPPPRRTPLRIIKSADQQASIFLHQKFNCSSALPFLPSIPFLLPSSHKYEWQAPKSAPASSTPSACTVEFGNWAVQRGPEAVMGPEECRKIVACMRGRIGDDADHGALVDPTGAADFAYVNKSLKGKWAALHAMRLDRSSCSTPSRTSRRALRGIVDELLGQGAAVFGEAAKNQWGSYCIQHILEHGSEKHRQMALEHLTGLLEFATTEQGSKSVFNALKEGGKETFDHIRKNPALLQAMPLGRPVHQPPAIGPV
ncbi:hypothetical protein B0H14DRAFT_3640918 [Mycena olivaceomarginata]|nr:hypothetical protein B0H14DRAFT_3640918 [Mycena olivaceomarginata]